MEKIARLFFIAAILSLIVPVTVCGQTVYRKFKTFADSSFKPGDIILSPVVSFKLADCSLIPEGKDTLKYIADFVLKHPTFKIEIGAHTDTRGKEDANLKLSACRAETIADCLINDFKINSDKITSRGYGNTQLLITDDEIKKATCTDCEGRFPKNRRIEIKILQIN